MTRTRRGVSAIEFALGFTVLFVLLLGIVDWGWFMVQYLDVQVAVTRGARLAAGVAESPETTAHDAVCAALTLRQTGCDHGTVAVTTGSDGSGPTLEVRYDLPFHAPVAFVPTPSVVHATATTSWYGWLYT